MTPEERWANPHYWNYQWTRPGHRALLARLVRQERAAHLAIMRILKGRAA